MSTSVSNHTTRDLFVIGLGRFAQGSGKPPVAYNSFKKEYTTTRLTNRPSTTRGKHRAAAQEGELQKDITEQRDDYDVTETNRQNGRQKEKQQRHFTFTVTACHTGGI